MTFKAWLDTLPPEARDDAEERAAIREYDGGMRRDAAEARHDEGLGPPVNASEFMAMLDDRLSDGHHYPTLDDYSAALETLREADRPSDLEAKRLAFERANAEYNVYHERREREAAARQGGRGQDPSSASESRVGLPGPAQVAPPKPTESYEPVQPLSRAANHFVSPSWVAMPVRPPANIQTEPLRHCFRMEIRTPGADWYRTDQRFTEEHLAEQAAAAIRRWQPHVQVRVVPTEERL